MSLHRLLWATTGFILACSLSVSAQTPGKAMPIAAPTSASQGAGQPAIQSSRTSQLEDLLQRAHHDGQVNVIATLNLDTSFREEGALSDAGIRQQRALIARAADQAISDLTGSGAKINRQYQTIPALALRVDAAGLEALSRSSHISRISEDALSDPQLTNSVPHIGGTAAWASGYDGTGWTVAILDTGIDTNHAFFRNPSNTSRIVAEACFSNAGGGGGNVSLCPNGTSSQTGAGASNANITSCLNGSNQLCNHGSHVAGISAGYSSTRKGVAHNAGIISIQVFTRFNSASNCSPNPAPCVMTYNSDQMAALDHINSTLRPAHQIASINMSLGGGGSSSYCDNDARKPIIDTLRSHGIATVIATGNAGRTNQIGTPSCISTSVAVSSTTLADQVSSFSDAASIMDLFAPGSSISSSVAGGYATYDGTSMATPHVAGAWAVMKQAKPSASVTEILNAFIATGISVTDQRFGGSVTKPRIQLDAALALLLGTTTHTVTPSLGSGLGLISPSAPQIVVENNTTSFTLSPGVGHTIGSVTGCNGNLAGNVYTTGPIIANCTVTAHFTPTSGNGDLVCSGPIGHAIQNNIDGTSVNWITGDIQNADVSGYHFNPYSNGNQLTFWWGSGAPNIAGVSAGPASSEFLVLNSGEVVGPASTWSTLSNPGPAAWAAGADGYLGFRFNCASVPDAPPSGICYGYTHLITTAPNGFPATLVDFCWDKAGNAIVVPGSNQPSIDVTPASLSANQAADASSSQTLSITNTGTAPLTWSIEEEPASRPIALGLQGIDAPLATVSLVLDDGSAENNIGIGGASQFLYLNRFSPPAGDYPFVLNQIQVYFDGSANTALVGDNILLAVYENTSGNTNPATGSNLLATFPATVEATGAWNTYSLPSPVTLNGPGDVLIGVVAQKIPGVVYFPAAIDTTASQQRSWAGWWSTATAPTPPTLPPNATWVLIDSIEGIVGNWLVRGTGETVPTGPCTALADVPWLSVSPTSSTTAPGISTSVTVGFNTAGMTPGNYNANLCIASNDPVRPLIAVPVELTVASAPATHVVTAAVQSGDGTITPSSQNVTHGSNASGTYAPASGWSLTGLSGNTCTPADNGDGTWTAANITAACTITATFTQDPVDGVCGSAHGGTFTSAPSENLCSAGTAGPIAGTGPWNWTCSGSAGGDDTQCNADIQSYSVTANASGNGTITPSSQNVTHGSNASGTYAPASGWSLTGLSGNTCTPADNGDGIWTAANITAACTITATFEEDIPPTWTITPSVGTGNGAILPGDVQTVNDGGTFTFTLVPADSSQVIHNVEGSCGGTLAGDQYTTQPVTAHCTVTVNFADIGIFQDGFED